MTRDPGNVRELLAVQMMGLLAYKMLKKGGITADDLGVLNVGSLFAPMTDEERENARLRREEYERTRRERAANVLTDWLTEFTYGSTIEAESIANAILDLPSDHPARDVIHGDCGDW